jgi:Interferon-induced transmembrane protein
MTESEPTTAPQAPAAPRPAAPPPLGPPPHHVGWAVAAVLFFWPLSFSAFTHAFNVYPLWAAGNYAGAQYASDRARRLGQLSLWIAGGLLLLFIIFYAIFLIVLISHGGDWGHHRRYPD